MTAPGGAGRTGAAALAGDDTGYPNRGYAWGVVAILVATAIISYTDRQVLSLLVDPVRRDLGISDTGVSLLMGTAFALVYGAAGIPFGWLADRTSRRNLIFGGVLIWSLGTLGCGYARSFGELFAARLVVGLGESVLSPAAIALISDYFPPARRGLAVGCFLSGIAIGIGAAFLIGGGVLNLVESGAFAGTMLGVLPAWRLVLLTIGAPGLAWAFVILLIREPTRRSGPPAGSVASLSAAVPPALALVVPIYLVVALASLVDNAVGAWAPTLLIRGFAQDAAQVGVQLGLATTAGFGGGVLAGGWLADRAGRAGGWPRKLLVCLGASVAILPTAWAIDAARPGVVLTAVPLYFALSGIVTACGFSAILDAVPNHRRGFAMAVSFFLNVAVGAGVGPTSVALASEHLFGAAAGLGPAIASIASTGFAVVAIAILLTLTRLRAAARLA